MAAQNKSCIACNLYPNRNFLSIGYVDARILENKSRS